MLHLLANFPDLSNQSVSTPKVQLWSLEENLSPNNDPILPNSNMLKNQAIYRASKTTERDVLEERLLHSLENLILILL